MRPLKKGNNNGRTTENKLTHFPGSKELIGQLVDVKITKALPTILHGERLQ